MGNRKRSRFIKRMAAFVLTVCIVAGMLPAVESVETQAMTTQSAAVQWARDQVGSRYNEGFGIQCVALVSKYCDYLGVPHIYGNAKDYVSSALPAGWSRLAGAAPQPGDVAIWTGGYYAQYGHVAIVLSANGNSFEVIDQNGGGNQEAGTIRTKPYGNGYWGVLRPNFNPEPFVPVIPQGFPLPEGAPRTISDGDYYIASALTGTILNPGPSCLTISGLPGAEDDNYANAQLWPVLGHKEHIFTVTWLGNGFYKIKLKGSASKCLDVLNGDTARGANVQQWEDNGTPAQQWQINQTDDGIGYTIRSRCSGWFLDVENGSTDAGSNIWLWEGNGTPAQRWYFIPCGSGDRQDIPDGDYEIIARSDGGKAINTAENGNNVELNVRGDDGKHVFQVTNLGDGYCKIINKSSGLSLDVADGKSVNGANVQLCSWSEGTNHAQQWLIRPCGNGYCNIVSKLDGLYLDLLNAKTDSGTNVQMCVGWGVDGADCQQWRFVPWGRSIGQTVENGEYRIVPLTDESKVLSTAGNAAEDGANIGINPMEADGRQTFDVQYLGGGCYSIIDTGSDLALAVAGGGLDNASNVQLAEKDSTDAQKWMIQGCGDGTYRIISKSSGLYLDLEDAGTDGGTNVWTWMPTQTNTQKWNFMPYGTGDKPDGNPDDSENSKDNEVQSPVSCPHAYHISIVPATASSDGSITKKCSKCGNTESTPVYAIQSVSLSKDSYVYNGKAQKPSVIVKDSRGKTLKSGTDYTAVYPKGRKNVGGYAVDISFRGNYTGTVKKLFTVVPKPARLSGIKPVPKGFTVKWKKQPVQITGYEISYSAKKKYTKKTAKIITVSKSKTSRTVSRLKPKKYYVRIRTYKNVKINGKTTRLYSAWSKPKKVSVR